MRVTQALKEFGQPTSHKRKQAYQIGQHLGSGEFGEVKLATEVRTGKKVAIKIVSKAHYASLNAQTERLNEYAKLSHPNVMKMLEWFESREKYYFVLQYMSGGELYDVVEKRNHLPEGEARDLTIQLTEACEFLHKHHIVHRDLKLENLLVDDDHTHVVVGDMGLSVRLSSADQLLYARCGSLGYSAPEIYSAHREGYCTPVDMWSLGVVVFLLVSGRFPFVGNTPQEVAAEGMAGRIRFTNHPPWTEVSAECINFIRGLLEPDPNKRLTASQALEHPWILLDEKAFKPSDEKHALPSREASQASNDELQLRRTVTQKEKTTKMMV